MNDDRTFPPAAPGAWAGRLCCSAAAQGKRHHDRPPRRTRRPRRPPAPTDWARLSARLDGTLLVPGDGAYDATRRVENPRYDSAMPLAILVAASAADVAAGLAFAAEHRVPWRCARAGTTTPAGRPAERTGPAFRRPSSSTRAGCRRSRWATTVRPAWRPAPPWRRCTRPWAARAARWPPARAPPSASPDSPSAAASGVLVRAYGLTCDALTELQIVTADGRVRTVSDTADPDLFWACRGGGGGHLGVVTSLTFATHPAPKVTTWNLRWPFADCGGGDRRPGRHWAPHADPRLWSTLKLLNGARYTAGPGLFLSGTWIGEPDAVAAALAPLLTAVGTQPSQQSSAAHSYLDAMMGYAGCRNIPVQRCTTAPGGKLTRESAAATSHVAYAPLGEAGIAALLAKVDAAKDVPGLVEGGVSLDALGGAVADLADDATAFGHRSAMMTVQYTATFPDGADPAPLDSYVHDFRTAMVPYWGYGAYVNYADASITNWADAYFAGNAARLARVRRQYDPHGLFTQPQ